jgi:hypothetical protein
MNRIFLTSVLFILFSCTTVLGQEKSKEAVSKSKTELVQSKTSGLYSFSLPVGTTDEQVQQNSKYYTNYFTVNYDVATQTANITMITNDERSRHVICRFLIASGVETINVEGKKMEVESFYNTFMK